MLLGSSHLDLLPILIDVSLQLRNFTFVLEDHCGVTGGLDHVSKLLDSSPVLVPHVPVVSDSDSILIYLSLVVDDSSAPFCSSPLEDLPAAGVLPSPLNGLLLELIDDSSLLVVMMSTTAGTSDYSGCS